MRGPRPHATWPLPPGFGLIEALVALGIVVAFAAGVLPLFVGTRGALAEAHAATMSVVLARSKLEQLRTLAWSYRTEPGGALRSVTDGSTSLASDPPSLSGPGLRPSPADSLWTSAPGYVDAADDRGVWVAGFGSPPATARYLRRWAVSTLPGDPDTMVLQVRVVPLGGPGSPEAEGQPGRLRGEVVLTTLETRSRP